MNILVDTNVFVSIAEKYSNDLATYNMLKSYGEDAEEPESIPSTIKNLIGNNTLCTCNIIRRETYTKLQEFLENKDITKEARDITRGIVQNIPNGLEYDQRLDNRVTKINLEQENDQRIYLTASVNSQIDCILTSDHHFPPFPEGFSIWNFRKVPIKRPNKTFKKFFDFLPKKKNEHYYSNSIAGRLLEKFDKLLHMFS